MNNFFFKLIFVFLSLNINIFSFPVIELNESNINKNLGQYLEILEDSSDELTIDNIASGNFKNQFIPSPKEIPNFGFSSYTYWIKLKVANPKLSQTKWLLEINTANMEFAQLYTAIENNQFTLQESGTKISFSKFAIPYPSRVFILDIPAGETRTLFIKLKTNLAFVIPIRIWSEEKFQGYAHDEQFIWGIYYGILIVAIFYNLLLYLSIGDITYLFYITYLIPYLLFQISYNGTGHQYMEFFFLNWGSYSVNFFSSLSCIGGILFVRSFLNTNHQYKKWDRFIFWQILPFLFIAITCSPKILIHQNWIFPFTAGLVSIPIFSFLFMGIYLIFKKQKYARYFLLAWISLLVGTSLLLLKDFGIFPLNFFTEHGTQIGSALEVILLSLALAHKVNVEKKIKENALRLQIEESEKVAKLTDSFKRYVPIEFLNLLEKESILDVKLGDYQNKPLTVLFSDIRSFTTLSESMSPANTFQFVQSYFNRMEPCIRKNKGFIDKYIGDAILAIFNGNVENAVQSAIEMNLALSDFNTSLSNPIRIGIGIHSGNLLLGTVGSNSRMDGTVISNDVKIAMQLEELTKKFGIKILISESTKSKLSSEHFCFRYLGDLPNEENINKLAIYEVLNCEPKEIFELKKATKEEFERGVHLIAEWNLQEAKNIFLSILQQNSFDSAAVFFLDQCNLILEQKQI